MGSHIYRRPDYVSVDSLLMHFWCPLKWYRMDNLDLCAPRNPSEFPGWFLSRERHPSLVALPYSGKGSSKRKKENRVCLCVCVCACTPNSHTINLNLKGPLKSTFDDCSLRSWCEIFGTGEKADVPPFPSPPRHLLTCLKWHSGHFQWQYTYIWLLKHGTIIFLIFCF